MSTLDWDLLHKEAISAMKTAYAPYSKFPVGLENSVVLVVDPMLASGGSASKAIDIVKEHGGDDNMVMAAILHDVLEDLYAQDNRTQDFLDKYYPYRDSQPEELGSRIEQREKDGGRWGRRF